MASTDEELVARSRGGDLDSFNQLVVRWERPIYALAYRVIGREEDARDVAQETFLRAFRALSGFKGQAKFSSWLYRITLNLCRDWIRRERRAPVAQAPTASTSSISLGGRAGGNRSKIRRPARVGRALRRRWPCCRRTTNRHRLKEYHGLTFQEMPTTRCPLSPWKTRRIRGRVLRKNWRTPGRGISVAEVDVARPHRWKSQVG